MSPNKGTIIAKTWFLAKKYTLLHIDNQLFPRKFWWFDSFFWKKKV